jgi:hypothetical protein
MSILVRISPAMVVGDSFTNSPNGGCDPIASGTPSSLFALRAGGIIRPFETWKLRMPWTSNDAEKHTHKASTSALKDLWAKVANESLEKTGDEGRAIREANAVVGRQAEQH